MQNHFPYHWGAATSWVKFSSCWMVHGTVSQQFMAGWGGGGGCLQWKWQCQGAESSYPGWHWAGAWALTCLLWPKLPSAYCFAFSSAVEWWDAGLGHGAGSGWSPPAHHHPGTSNSSCWWWDQGCLPSRGLTLAFVVQSYLLAASWCSFTLVAMGTSPTTHKVSQPSLACTSQTSHSNLHDFLAYQEALHHQPSVPSRVHMEGRDGSDGCKGK